MTPDPEPWQLVREDIRTLRGEMREQLKDLVPTGTHAADLRRVDDRLADLAGDVAAERAQRVESIAENRANVETLRSALETEAKSRRLGDERDLAAIRSELASERSDRKATVRWLVGTVIAAIVASTAVIALLTTVLHG